MQQVAQPPRYEAGRSTTEPGWDRLALFCHVWALATLFDGARWVVQGVWWGWPIAASSLLAVVQPRRLWPFVLAMLAATAFVCFGYKPNWIPNHTYFIALGNLVIFAALLREGLAKRANWPASPAARERVLERFAPSLIWMLLIVYAFVVLHKLNADFFDPQVSCAASMYARLAKRYFFLPAPSQSLRELMIWTTVCVEALIPLLLLFRPTRIFGVALGFGFHFVLAQHPHGQLCTFASMLYAVYFLCLPRTLANELVRQVAALQAELAARVPRRLLTAGIRVLLLLALVGVFLAYRRFGANGVYNYSNAVWNVWAICVLGLGLSAVLRVGIRSQGPLWLSAPRTAIGWAMLAFVLFVGLNPYLGLRTETAWSMFSNLRTEVRPNHLFMPVSLAVDSLQSDLVEVVESDNAFLAELGKAHRLLPHFELRRRISREDDITVRFRHQGQEHTLVRMDGRSSDPDLIQPVPWLAGLWLHFRPVYEAEKSKCSH